MFSGLARECRTLQNRCSSLSVTHHLQGERQGPSGQGWRLGRDMWAQEGRAAGRPGGGLQGDGDTMLRREGDAETRVTVSRPALLKGVDTPASTEASGIPGTLTARPLQLTT